MTGKAGLGAANWTKSSFSSGGDNCVEVAFADGVTGIRDSKVTQCPVLTVTADAFAAFLDGVQGSGLDRTV
ncbi:hypothetical protein GCM10015535_44770 [Streptomyces gelaticus]|uniref:DUF397 domain-containing protein n=1 Tax=Streptomyces gelaticus TaxID=285446 RepID=A0ABQ2W2B6_9ACTN|nr:DUF397 domain-containing protein [Streptomyces gelaticus]GGV89882.1 hypothetical protein GCM10015535_44770 [Streptomyces gelaticus]